MMINLKDKESFFSLVDQVFEKNSAFKQFFSSTSTLNVVMNQSGKALFLSNSWERALGFSYDELKSAPLKSFTTGSKGDVDAFIHKNGEVIKVKWISMVDSKDNKYKLGTAIIVE